MTEKVKASVLSYFYDFVIENQTIYFPLANYNAICKGELTSDQIDIIDIFPDLPEDRKCVCTGIYRFKDYLLLHEEEKGNVLVYDFIQHRFSKLPCKKNIGFFSGTVFEHKDCLYMVNILNAEIYKVDPRKNLLQIIKGPENISDDVTIGNMIRSENLIIIPLNHKKELLIFEMEKETFRYDKYPSNISVIYNLSCRKNELWIIGEDGKIYTWNVGKGEAHIYTELPENIEHSVLGVVPLIHSFIHDDNLWLFPPSNIILKFNILTKRFDRIEIPGETKSLNVENVTDVKYDIVKKIGNRIFLESSKERSLYEVNLSDNKIQKHYFSIINTFRGQLYPRPESGKMMEENYIDGLEFFIKIILMNDENEKEDQESNAGKAINKYINNDKSLE